MAFNDDMVNLVMKVFDGSLIRGITVSVDGVYRSVQAGTYSPITGSITQDITDHTIKVIKKESISGTAVGDYDRSSVTDTRSTTAYSDYLEFMIVPITGVLPSQGIDDELILEEKTYKVMSIESKDLGPNKLIYILKAVG
tara:strand:+ start:5085 stop:5504 length:420 start_codon:yes stop_codon:yes gene_type:complete